MSVPSYFTPLGDNDFGPSTVYTAPGGWGGNALNNPVYFRDTPSVEVCLAVCQGSTSSYAALTNYG
jgi:hypothetical protein